MKVGSRFCIKQVAHIDGNAYTRLYTKHLKKYGMVIDGLPRYIATTALFDGNDYSIIHLGDATNSNNTLEHRWIQSEALLKSKVLRPMTLIGAGYGEITELKNSVFMENSILYYLWKYGVAVTICMLITILHNSWMAFRSHVPQLRAVSLSLLIVLVVGNFSGNLNMYYFVPALSFVFAYPQMRSDYYFNGEN